ncbi:bifunctional diguanylate cyclase/phosphodiesterase [Pullulanibacillus camelliae]|uniref:Bifunctional diguanylate cyclase/phosphodiesterase n=1 Tax=Pullulanibacillus camelliae TaxID=1707096 RepID=A0A8J2YL78_9BACL|nr:EAL domain-containing protein [Pullulanibacillus camelliae]GGE50274.1 bifunctional diguanylate cyclase/phosphodiesterase [Pullulanibacillus camelliae]
MSTYIHFYEERDHFNQFLKDSRINKMTKLWIKLVNAHDPSIIKQIKAALPNAQINDITNEAHNLVLDKPLVILTTAEGQEQQWLEQMLEKDQLRAFPLEKGNEAEWQSKYEALFTHYQALVEDIPHLIYSLNAEGQVTHINKHGQLSLGYGRELVAQKGMNYVSEKHQQRATIGFLQALQGKSRTMTIDLLDDVGQVRPFKITFIPVRDQNNTAMVYGVGIDLSAQKKAEKKIKQLVSHDALTGLANRSLFRRTLQRMVRDKNNGSGVAVVFLDFDRFNLINEAVGHDVGDQILKLAAQRVRSKLSSHQLLARFDSTKFSIGLPGISSRKTIDAFIQSIKTAFTEPLLYGENEYYLSVSMGVSVFPENGTDADVLMKNADLALYATRMAGNHSSYYYSNDMNAPFQDQIEFEGYLRKALKKREFILYYQPQVCVDNGTIIGCEALIRWKHPKLGILSPVHFIPLAEEIGLIEDIGLWVLRTACQQINEWIARGNKPFSISVNVSAKQFLKPDFIDQIQTIIDEEQVDPKYIHLEITESTTLRDIQYSISLVRQLKALGLRVSLDDFGTGYSALSYLKDFSIDILKIDRAFIKNLKENNQDSAIVKAIIMMCKGLSLKTIAEGVETKEQLNLLKHFGCHAVQGFLYSKPLPSKEFERMIHQLPTFA